MRIISHPAPAECELDHSLVSTMPSAKYSQRVDGAGVIAQQAVASGFGMQP
jgi:hypothetical protein